MPLHRLALATVLTLALAGGVATAYESTAGAVAEQLEGEEAECRFLLNLCWAAEVARDHAEGTPPSADVLAFRQAGKAVLAEKDAVLAARAIRKKHGGKKLWCFDEPECAFLKARE